MCTYVVPVLHEYSGPLTSFYIRATTITPTHIHHRCWCLLHQLVHSHGEHACSGTFSPLPVTVNPCAHAIPPLTVVEGSAVAPSPPSRAWLHAGALRVTPILRLCRFPCCRASCDSLLLLLLPPPPRPPPHLGIVGWCGKLVWTSSPLSSRTSLMPTSKGRCRLVEQLGVVEAQSIAAAPPLSIERLLAL